MVNQCCRAAESPEAEGTHFVYILNFYFLQLLIFKSKSSQPLIKVRGIESYVWHTSPA